MFQNRMPRKRPAPSLSPPRARVTRRSTATSSKQEWKEEEDDVVVEPSTSQPSKKKSQKGKKTKKPVVPVKQEEEEEEQEAEEREVTLEPVETEDAPEETVVKEELVEEEAGEAGTSDEPSPVPEPEPGPSSVKKNNKTTSSKKKKKKEAPPESPSPSPSPSRSPSPIQETSKLEEKSRKKGPKRKRREVSPEPPKSTTKPNAKRRRGQVEEEEEEETFEERQLRLRAERKARRIEEAKNRPKLTVEQKLAKIEKKKERRERRKQQEKEASMRQRYGSRKMKPETSKWNFGPISSINQRRRDEMMEFFPKATFQSDNGRPKVLNNFRRATVKYDMEVLNPFITCGICDGYIVDATTIIDCMHTFCKSCLLTYFESEKNTCPTCGTFIHGSHPTHYVTYDRAVNELVNQFVPQLEKKELEARKLFLRDCREALGIDTAAEDRERAERLEKERIRGTNRCYLLEQPRFSHHRDDCQVTINLLPGTPNLPLITRPFVRCSEMTTMNTLKKFISLQVWDDQSRYADLDMFCDGQLMGKDFSVRFVWMMKRRGQPKAEPLVIRYHMIRN